MPDLVCTECPYIFTEAELATEDKSAWGHPCRANISNPPTDCESFRKPLDEEATQANGITLLPCPFCGGDAAWGAGEQKTKYGNEQVYCSDCYAITAPEGTYAEAAENWNARNSVPELQRELAFYFGAYHGTLGHQADALACTVNDCVRVRNLLSFMSFPSPLFSLSALATSLFETNEAQKHRIRQAHKDASDVLREIKQKPLKGQALKDMKHLEEAVQILEVLALGN